MIIMIIIIIIIIIMIIIIIIVIGRRGRRAEGGGGSGILPRSVLTRADLKTFIHILIYTGGGFIGEKTIESPTFDSFSFIGKEIRVVRTIKGKLA